MSLAHAHVGHGAIVLLWCSCLWPFPTSLSIFHCSVTGAWMPCMEADGWVAGIARVQGLAGISLLAGGSLYTRESSANPVAI